MKNTTTGTMKKSTITPTKSPTAKFIPSPIGMVNTAVSQGETEKEALLNIREAIELVLEELESRAQAQKPDKLERVTVSV